MTLGRSVLIACLFVLPACSQGEDEACQVNSDCDDGLVCSIAGVRGTCVPPGEIREEDAGQVDSGAEVVDPDASVRDGATADEDAG